MAITQRSIIEDGMRTLVRNINNLPEFITAKICFHSDIQHFVDRLEDRKLDLLDVAPVIRKTIKDHLCEMIFYAYLDDRPIRFNIKTRDFIVGLTCSVSANTGKRVFRFRTIVLNFNGRQDSRVSTFILNMD